MHCQVHYDNKELLRGASIDIQEGKIVGVLCQRYIV